jgi:hypothetical protein
MDIFLQALNNYKDIIEARYDNIYNNENITEEEKNNMSIDILISHEKIEGIIKEINTTIEMGITQLTVKTRNSYFNKHGLSKDDLTEIKIVLRRIKNRYYKRDSVYRLALT